MASDGVYDCLTNEEITTIINSALNIYSCSSSYSSQERELQQAMNQIENQYKKSHSPVLSSRKDSKKNKVFDKEKNKISNKIFRAFDISENSNLSVHDLLGKANDFILKLCLAKSCSDNVTGVIIKLNKENDNDNKKFK